MVTPHVMLDLETLGTRPGSVILSIGAAAFDPNGAGVSDTFHVAIDQTTAQQSGLRIEADTVLWWMDPARAGAREALLKLPRLSLRIALLEFDKWLGRLAPPDARTIWGNGANFDNVLLRAAYEACWLTTPWTYRDDRCFRTLKKLAPHVGPHEFADRASALLPKAEKTDAP